MHVLSLHFSYEPTPKKSDQNKNNAVINDDVDERFSVALIFVSGRKRNIVNNIRITQYHVCIYSYLRKAYAIRADITISSFRVAEDERVNHSYD